MKKYIALIVSILVLLTVAISAYAEGTAEQYDSSIIEPEILEDLPLQEGDLVTRVYVGCIDRLFFKNTTINDIGFGYTDSQSLYENFYQIIYVITSADGSHHDYGYDEDGNLEDGGSNSWLHALMDIYHSDDIIKNVNSDIEVYSKCYIAGSGPSGTAIYYRTNYGDYVYYAFREGRSYMPPIEGCLFSAEAFHSFQTAVDEARESFYKEHPDGWIGGTGSSDLDWDLSAYEIGSENFNPDAEFVLPKDKSSKWFITAGIALCVCLLSAAIFLTIRSCRKCQAQK